MTESSDLGVRLRRQRESRGVSLQDVAHETKINPALLADLERGDLSQWPPGLYGRAFIRSYAEAVGLEPREVLTDFLRFVPADEGLTAPSLGTDEDPRLLGWSFMGSHAGSSPADSDGAALRLTLVAPERRRRLRVPGWWRRVVATATDGAILLAGAGVGLLAIGPEGWLPGLGLTAVFLVGLASAVLGTTPGRRLFGRSADLRTTRRAGPTRDRLRPRLFDRGESSDPTANGRP